MKPSLFSKPWQGPHWHYHPLFRGVMLRVIFLAMSCALLVSCTHVDLNASAPLYDTGLDPSAWAQVPAGDFTYGQHNHTANIDAYEIMVTDVTVSQYTAFLNDALPQGAVMIGEFNRQPAILAAYPGDTFHGVKHEILIEAADYILTPLNDPASRFTFDGAVFTVKSGWENHPMTNVSWFGAWTYCKYYGGRLPSEMEWEKAARGSTDDRAYPWGNELARNQANYYASRDPFENMGSFGSRTTPVGFYNGKTYNAYATLNGASPYGLYDMAGNVWQWVGDILPGFSDRFLKGGSKDTYDMDLRVWVHYSAPPMYFGPGVGFRCAR